jgi:hypothetical protein
MLAAVVDGSTLARPSVLPATVPTGRGPTIRFPLPGSPAAPREGARRTPRPRGSNDDGRRSRPWRRPKRRPRSGRCNPSRKRGPVRSGRVRDAPQRFIAIIGAVVLSLEERRLLSSGRGPLSALLGHSAFAVGAALPAPISVIAQRQPEVSAEWISAVPDLCGLRCPRFKSGPSHVGGYRRARPARPRRRRIG